MAFVIYKRPKKIKPVKAWGILNAFDEFWSPNAFESKAAAKDYLLRFWNGVTGFPKIYGKYKIIRVELVPLKIKSRKVK